MTTTTTPDHAAAPRTLRLDQADNVIIAIDAIRGREPVSAVVPQERIPQGHKMATVGIAQGEPVRKFGQIIGFASEAIEPGAWVHTHNVEMGDFDRAYDFAKDARDDAFDPAAAPALATFDGFRRSNGTTGTRNYIGVLTSVNCSASVARFAAQEVMASGLLERYANVDGVIAFTHGTGCGMAGDGDGYEALQRTLWGYATHPNLAGVLMVGLGCEMFQIARFKQTYGVEEHDGFRSTTIQDEGGTRKTIDRLKEQIAEMLPAADAARREPRPLSELMVALQCGGSDGYSGITANAALGRATDMLVAQGGTGVLAETPEIYGAEHLLTRRAKDEATGRKLVDLIHWWEDYTQRNRGNMNNNPSPGNKAGGLTTILEKSLGAAAKGGSTTLRGVYKYAERVDSRGFVFMDSPGYDPASVTGQVAAGCNIVCFTTGRGSAFGYKPAPSIKLATNSALYARMPDDMDINCGDVIDGVSIDEKAREILDVITKVASGARSKSEALGYGDNEFVPWQIGAVM
ncbi:MAG: altronate dehydratase family protein [Pseudomonadota bacterium]